MILIKYLIIIAILSLTLVNCSGSEKQVFENPPDKIYAAAQKNLQNRNWKKAIIQLETLNNHYAFGSYYQQIQLDLIYAYYKNNDLSMAKIIIDRFMRSNPIHPNIDYVIYMRGLTDMAFDDNILQRLIGIDRSDRDPRHARDAFKSFSTLVYNYPKSRYAIDAVKQLIFLKNRLAKYEYSIASYYSCRGAWVAVINRVEEILRNYPDTLVTYKALKLMENAYRQMQMNAQAEKVAKIIAINKKNLFSHFNLNILDSD